MLLFEKDLPKNTDPLKLFEIFCQMAKAINFYYIYKLFELSDSKIVLYSIDNSSSVDIENCPCGLIYQIDKKDKEINIYITFIATKYKYRSCGYASLFMNEFIEFIKRKYLGKFEKIEIILDSIMSAVTFYEHFGFKWTTTETKHNSIFNIDEKNKTFGEHFIMVYDVTA